MVGLRDITNHSILRFAAVAVSYLIHFLSYSPSTLGQARKKKNNPYKEHVTLQLLTVLNASERFAYISSVASHQRT